jgi:peptidyl-prolyl cis-trans isomerase SurA
LTLASRFTAPVRSAGPDRRRARLGRAGVWLAAALGLAIAMTLGGELGAQPTRGTKRPAQPSASDSREPQRIVAVVNDELITSHDVERRVKLVFISSGIPDTADNRKRVAQQVLRSLIEERVQLQEARRLRVTVVEQEIDEGIERIEKGNRMPAGSIARDITSKGGDINTLRDQIRAGISWAKLVRQRFGHVINITDDQVDEVMREYERNKDQPEYLVSEIFLPVDQTAPEAEQMRIAERIIQDSKGGANFPALAREFSQGTSAPFGGELGWVRTGQLAPEIDRVLATLQQGQVSGPIRTASGIHILNVRGRRIPSKPEPGPLLVSFRQIFVHVGENPTLDVIERQVGLAESIWRNTKSCAEMERKAKEIKSPARNDLNNLPFDQLPDQLKEILSKLKPGQTTQPMRIGPGLIILMLCDRHRHVEQYRPPTREDVRDTLFRQRMEQYARRYQRELRRAANVDIRQ